MKENSYMTGMIFSLVIVPVTYFILFLFLCFEEKLYPLGKEGRKPKGGTN